MIVDSCSITAPGNTPLVLGSVTHSTAGTSGITCELDTQAAPLAIYRSELVSSAGAVVVPGRRQAREMVLRGTVLGTSESDLAARWSTLVRALGGDGGALIDVSWSIGGVVRTVKAAVDGGLSATRVTPLAESFEVRLVCPDPLAYGQTLKTITLSAHPGTAAANVGDAAVPVVFRVNGPATGTTTAIRLGNSDTGAFVELGDITFVAGDVLIVDTTPGREVVTINGVSVAGKVTATSRWVTVRGSAHLYVTRTAGTGSPTGTAEYYDGWVS